jgi:hypothetical protein
MLSSEGGRDRSSEGRGGSRSEEVGDDARRETFKDWEEEEDSEEGVGRRGGLVRW